MKLIQCSRCYNLSSSVLYIDDPCPVCPDCYFAKAKNLGQKAGLRQRITGYNPAPAFTPSQEVRLQSIESKLQELAKQLISANVIDPNFLAEDNYLPTQGEMHGEDNDNQTNDDEERKSPDELQGGFFEADREAGEAVRKACQSARPAVSDELHSWPVYDCHPHGSVTSSPCYDEPSPSPPAAHYQAD